MPCAEAVPPQSGNQYREYILVAIMSNVLELLKNSDVKIIKLEVI
jgi:hypothetical protein